MKKTLLMAFCAFLLIAFKTTSAHSREDSLKKYYSHISIAENYYLCEEYSKAAKEYETAIDYHKYPFIRDVRNAIRCEMKSVQRMNIILNYHRLLAKAGEKQLKEYKIYNTQIQQIYQNTPTTNVSSLKRELQMLYDLDQGMRNLSSLTYSYLYNDTIFPYIKMVDSLCRDYIVRLYQKHPIVNEYTAGYSYFSNKVNTVLVHLERKSAMGDSLYQYLLKEVKKGNLDAREYAKSYDRYYNESKYGSDYYGHQSIMQWGDTIYYYQNPDIELINKRREDIFLGDLDSDLRRKIFGVQKKISVYLTNMDLFPEVPHIQKSLRESGKYIYFHRKDLLEYKCDN